jgi:hypothetical protein
MAFLEDKCTFRIYNKALLDSGALFLCGDKDLDEFFKEDAFLQEKELLCKNYCFTLDENPQKIVCAFTLSNDRHQENS